MNVSSLYIFSKNTDAHASIKGYNFQTLKTVETWLANYIDKSDTIIFCEFEEDIFEKGREVLKFRQVKLYSSNFSFSTEEVQKAIFHFFMLHVKTDYRDANKEFVFEANSSIAGKYRDNDADLLRNWNSAQGELTGELLDNCIRKAQEIIRANIDTLSTPSKEGGLKPELDVAKKIFTDLDSDEWVSFVQNIRWKFANNDPEIEFAETIRRINDLIGNLPYPNIDESALLGILYKHVSLKSSERQPEDRALSRPEFDQILLSTGSDDDRWYIEVYDKWRGNEGLMEFRIGDFYEILNAAKHCRTTPYLVDHTSAWLEILAVFIFHLDVRRSFKLEAVYEYIWLNVRPMGMYKLPIGTLDDVEDVIRDYFSNFQDFHSTNDLENAQSILSITSTVILMRKAKISLPELSSWFKSLFKTLVYRLHASTNPNEKCHLLEELGTLKMQLVDYREKETSPDFYIQEFEEILKYIDAAPLYHLNTLGKRINAYINIYIKSGNANRKKHIEEIERFSEKLDAYVRKRSGDIELAKIQVERGVAYLKSDNRNYFINALTNFHKAKELYFTNETIEGFVLALFNIAQVYSVIGMHFAAKYYALAAGWICINNGSEKLLNRIETAYRLMFYSDYKSGAWLSAIMDIERSFDAANEFTPTRTTPDIDNSILNTLSYLVVIFYVGRKFSPQFAHFIDYQIKRFGEDYINEAIVVLEELDTERKIIESLEQRIDNAPYNDCSKRRKISFYALGTLWQLEFDTSYDFTAIAEEFCSTLQIILTEISLSNVDFHFIKGTVKVNLSEGEFVEPEQVANSSEFELNVTLAVFESTNVNDVRMHFARTATRIVSILNTLSLLPTDEFISSLTAFLGERSLPAKSSVVNAYQKIYRLLFQSKDFERLQIGVFQPIEQRLNLPRENQFLGWKSDLSSKYDAAEAAKTVEKRFEGTARCIHKTIATLKNDEEFKKIVRQKRALGYTDWEIALATMNFIVNHKVYVKLQGRKFSSEEEYVKTMGEEFQTIATQDEEKFYIKFPAEAFKSNDFEVQMKQLPHIVLKTYGLENKSTFLNFETLREFLSVRFRLYEKADWKNNFLKEIV